jgi:hypothetical protein
LWLLQWVLKVTEIQFVFTLELFTEACYADQL